MDSRAQFEEWLRNTPNGSLWDVWQASRAVIEVELPGKVSSLNATDSGFVLPEAASYDEAIDDCTEAIRAVGISIKGEPS